MLEKIQTNTGVLKAKGRGESFKKEIVIYRAETASCLVDKHSLTSGFINSGLSFGIDLPRFLE